MDVRMVSSHFSAFMMLFMTASRSNGRLVRSSMVLVMAFCQRPLKAEKRL
jgi:hypothetical protein